MTLHQVVQSIVSGKGAPDIVQFVAGGGDPNAVDTLSKMPLLHIASEHQNIPAIIELIASGANVNARDGFGQSALHIAVDIDIDSIVQDGREPEDITFDTARTLVIRGADLAARDIWGRTPRDIAAGYGPADLDVFDRLVGSIESV
jgi:ankyrin repeat protein